MMEDTQAQHYQWMLELQQWEEEEIDRINLELSEVSEYSLTYDMLQFCNN
jgi:hypothetical protein